MLTVCMYGKGAIPGGGQTLSEYRAQYSVWSIMASPMLHGADLRTVQKEHPDCHKLIINADIIKVNQDPAALPARMVYQHPPFPEATTGEIVQQIFARPLSGGRTALILLNRGEASLKMTATWKQLGFASSSEKFAVYDVIAQKPHAVSSVAGKFEATVPSHDVSFVILTPLATSTTNIAV